MGFFQILPPDTKFDFVGKFKYALVLSAVLISIVLVGVWKKGLNFGVDFTGGTSLTVKFPQPTKVEDARKLMDELGAKDATVVELGTDDTEYMITSRSAQDVKGVSALQQQIEAKLGKGSILQADVVGPRVGSELKFAAIQSLFYSVLFIMIYIWFRFDVRFAPGATIALIHDLIMIVGFYVFTQKEFNITAVAALLTIAGYGVNDTIVIYDYVRDLLKSRGEKTPIADLLNEAVNFTLSRTVVTATLVFLAIVPIYVVCEGELKDFAAAMMVGVILGSYSTFYIAVPTTIMMEKLVNRREKRASTRVVSA